MASATVHVKGLRELQRALSKVNKGVGKTVRDELKKVAEPISATAQQKLSRFSGLSVGTIGPRVAMGGVFVTDRAKKVTGLRPDAGVLIMRTGLEPALEEHADEVVHDLERALDRLGDSAGF